MNLGSQWAIRFTGRIGTIKSYTVEEGPCWLKVDGVGDPVRLAADDAFMLPSGSSFTLSSNLDQAPVSAADVLGGARHGAMVVHGGGNVRLTGSRFELDERKAEALLGELAPIVHLKAAEEQAVLRWSINRIMADVREGRPGLSLVTHHLARLMLLQALQLHLAQASGERVGWFYALADPQVGAAMAEVHAHPARCWTSGSWRAGPACRGRCSRDAFESGWARRRSPI